MWCICDVCFPCCCCCQETDAGLLSVISYPAFAVDDPELIDLTRTMLLDKLRVMQFTAVICFCYSAHVFIEDLRLLNNVHVCYIMLFLVSVVTGWRLTNLTVNFKLLRLTRGFPDVSEETIYDSRSSIIQLNVVVDTSCWNCRGWRDLYICSAVPLRIDILIT